MTAGPALIVVSGMPGAGKTTLAHHPAATVGCPAICRDEIKEGLVQAAPDFSADRDGELSRRANTSFFEIIGILIRAGATTVAEAAFQDRLWRPGPDPSAGAATTLRALTRDPTPGGSMATPDLSNNHRDTLKKIFAHPVSHNVEWQDVIGLLGAVGDIEERHGNLAVTLGGETEVLHRHGSEKWLDADAVMSLRKLLASHGIEPS